MSAAAADRDERKALAFAILEHLTGEAGSASDAEAIDVAVGIVSAEYRVSAATEGDPAVPLGMIWRKVETCREIVAQVGGSR
mgnify:CR=1 FL=1